MLPFDAGLSYASAVLPPLRTHTATRALPAADVGVHVHVLLVDQACITVHAPSNTHHLNCGAVPPETVAVNVTGVPTACGAGRLAVKPVSVSEAVAGGVIANGRL